MRLLEFLQVSCRNDLQQLLLLMRDIVWQPSLLVLFESFLTVVLGELAKELSLLGLCNRFFVPLHLILLVLRGKVCHV